MAKNLILTGWHYPEYLAAAAAVYGNYKGDADVLGVSMAELAGTLDTRGGNYKSIDILGVGLTENLERLGRVLKELAKKGVCVRWFSRSDMPEAASEALRAAGAAFGEVKIKKADTLVHVVADYFDGITEADAKRYRLIATQTGVKIDDYAKGAKFIDGRKTDISVVDVWQLLHQAAGFAHRDNSDETACEFVVKSLSNNVSVVPALKDRLKRLMDDYQSGYRKEMLGKNPVTVETRKRLQMAAEYSQANVLILGETGTGKQVAAEYIHSKSGRTGSFKHYNCAYGGSDDMLMTRLFGYEKGAFTDAKEMHKGLFDDADGGTLFLDEIGEAKEGVQAMLLTVLETGTFIRVGGTEKQKVHVNVRLVCATNRDLQEMVLQDRFRLDLYQRISEFPIRLSPLRDRKDDIEPLVKHYWRNMTGRMATKKQIAALMNYDYPGNVRELISLLKQAKALGEDDFAKILAAHESFNKKLIDGLRQRREGVAPVEEYPDNQEELLCRHAVNICKKYDQNLTKASEAADISPNTLKKYLKLAKMRGIC